VSVEPGPPLAEVLRVSAAAWQRFRSGLSLDRAITAALGHRSSTLRPAVVDVTYTGVRHLVLAEKVIGRLARKPPSPELSALLSLALGQLAGERYAEYTVVDQTVAATRATPSVASAAGFVNAILRSYLRQRDAMDRELLQDDVVRYNVPVWWLEAVRSACPSQWQAVLAAHNEAPPLVLRVSARSDVDAYPARCAAAGLVATRVGARAVRIDPPRPVAELPGFGAGEVSVQDAGAQLAAPWLSAASGQRVLDACAAPGGKTVHLAETAGVDVTALEIDAERAGRISENLTRTGTRAKLVIGDAADPERWWDGRPYDRILLDAPCTASGIVRRHPDIPWLRRPDDVAHLTTVQGRLLAALWPLLGVGGRLLYVVCSLFPDEGAEQIARFTVQHRDAREVPLPPGTPRVQLLPTPAAAPAWDGASALPTLHDGFFYALLEKIR
jgi:16S rRNA (cytosine967-C5)-methyltransferase